MKVQRIFSVVLSVAALAGLPGCMWSRVKVNDPSVVERSYAVKEGVTAESELERILEARPTVRMPGKEQHTLAYSFSDTKHNGLMLLIVNLTRSTTIAETLYIDIDSATGKVKKVHRPDIPEVEWRFWPFGAK